MSGVLIVLFYFEKSWMAYDERNVYRANRFRPTLIFAKL